MLAKLRLLGLCACIAWLLDTTAVLAAEPSDVDEAAYSVRQITFGPRHHFFGYIGHVGTIPWNASGRYIVALRVGVHDDLPGPGDPAEVVLIDTRANYATRVVGQTRAWNPQQGTMLYWNPRAPETQLFFNDRDPKTGQVFAVLLDISTGISQGSFGERVREYRSDETPFGNSGVAQKGKYFLGINYGRLARLRPVTGYAEVWDWTTGEAAPANDGIFLVDVKSGGQRLLVSFAQLREKLRESVPAVSDTALFINHTLWNRDDDRIFFFVRGNFSSKLRKIDIPMTIDPWSERPVATLQRQQFIGGHPEWEVGHTMIGHAQQRQVLYDTDSRKIVGQLGSPGDFPQPGGDIALSPDGTRFVNGYGNRQPGENTYAILSRRDNQLIRTQPFSRGDKVSGALRIDPAPRWNRQGNQILVSAISDDPGQTRQLFIIRLEKSPVNSQ